MSEALRKNRAALSQALDDARDASRAARVAHQEAKAAVLAFDEKHPEVMREANATAGALKAAAKAADGEAE